MSITNACALLMEVFIQYFSCSTLVFTICCSPALHKLSGQKYPIYRHLVFVEMFFCNIDLLGDILAEKPVEASGTECIIVVDNVPAIGQDRVEKLKNVIRKVFSKFGKIVTENYPTDENGITKG